MSASFFGYWQIEWKNGENCNQLLGLRTSAGIFYRCVILKGKISPLDLKSRGKGKIFNKEECWTCQL